VTEDAVLARSTLTSAAGTVAHATARFAMLRAASRAAGTVTPDADERQGSAAADGPADAPILEVLGARVAEAADGRAAIDMRVHPGLRNERSGLHGGVGALMGEQTAAVALRTLLPAQAGIRPVELRVAFLRPVEVKDAAVLCRAAVMHAGRRFAASRAELFSPSGQLAVLIDVLHAITPAAAA
jgi:uncharacterized protein (TIGR00369 family)